MNLKEIKEMIKLMNENDLTEIEVEREGMKIKLKKSALESFESYTRPVEYPRAPVLPPTISEENTTPKKSTTPSVDIVSPMVGTLYRAPSPEAPPFVEVGQIVEVGQVVCIIEAMKLMNEIKSEVHGRVVEIAVENSEPVEFGQLLFVIEAA